MHDAPSTIDTTKVVSLLDELELRQDELLAQLDDLNQRIEHAIVAGQLSIRIEPPVAA